MIIESSPLNFKGSCTDDLLLSKLHLARLLKELGHDQHAKIYNLGSWYGNMAPILAHQGIRFKRLVNVDKDPNVESKSVEVADHFDLGHLVKHLVGDVNRLNYKYPSLVINTSCNDIDGDQWFNRIPKGTLVALQTRDMPDFKLIFPLKETLHYGKLKLQDPKVKYIRQTKIGIK
jgi:hypothetical protein